MKSIITKLFDTQKAPPLLFLLVIYVIGITTGNLGDAFQAWLTSWQIAAIGSIILVLIMLFLDPFPKLINYLIRGRGVLISNMGNPPQRHKGIIVLCSLGENIPAEQAIRYHYKGLGSEHTRPALERCWMIIGGQASLDSAKKLVSKLVMEGFSPDIFTYVEMAGDDADDPAKVYERIESIYEDLPAGFEDSDIIADYTGGTKSMTGAMILACAFPQRELEVLRPREYKEDGTANRPAGSDPRQIDIRFKLRQVAK